jgi:PPOX class probable F420-dependent enzyme
VRASWFVKGVTTLLGLGTGAIGVWCLASPGSFAAAVAFPPHEHFLHDAGAFQLGLAAGLLLAVIWHDALATVLAGFLLANTVHAIVHATDLELGGSPGQAWSLASVSLLTAVALILRLRQLGYVVGAVTPATTPALEPFVRQKTVRLITYRRNGTPVPTQVSLAVAGDRAVFRSFEKAGKTKRLRANSSVEVTPSTMAGRPTGTALHGRARRLGGAEAAAAARLLARKHPMLQGVLVPLLHRTLLRAKTGRTVHFELTPQLRR